MKRPILGMGVIALFIAALASPVQANFTINLHNKNCTSVSSSDSVKVRFVDPNSLWCGCSEGWITLKKDSIGPGPGFAVTEHPVNVSLVSSCSRLFSTYTCSYTHEAEGTASFSTGNVDKNNHDPITCEQDGAGVCQCK